MVGLWVNSFDASRPHTVGLWPLSAELQPIRTSTVACNYSVRSGLTTTLQLNVASTAERIKRQPMAHASGHRRHCFPAQGPLRGRFA